MKCVLCSEPSDSSQEYCTVHQRALNNVKEAFSRWTLAYGRIEVSDFLDRLEKLDQTGQRAKEIVTFLRDRTEILK